MTVRITEAELARDVRAVMEKVEQGSEVIIEQEDHRPVAVTHALRRGGRPITEILTEARKRNSTATLDEDFGTDLEEIIASHQPATSQPPSRAACLSRSSSAWFQCIRLQSKPGGLLARSKAGKQPRATCSRSVT